MIAFLRGKLASKNSTSAFVDVNGVGYEVFMSKSSLMSLPQIDSEILLYTYLQISDTGAALYGFSESEDEQMFRSLISVTGIGPKIALAALSTFSSAELLSAILSQDVANVSKIPGVGKKSAQRIILELKDKLSNSDMDISVLDASDGSDSAVSSVRLALLGMGFTSKECDIALTGAHPHSTEPELLQYALKKLGKGKG